MRVRLDVALIGCCMMCLAVPAMAAERGRGGGAEGGDVYTRLYDPATVRTLGGEVLDVRKLAALRDVIAIVVRTKSGEEVVHLGPAWYLDHLDVRVAKGDHVTVQGSRVNFAGGPVLIAASVQKGAKELRLRDAKGVPVWAGHGVRSPVR